MAIPQGVRYRDMSPEHQRECRVNLAIVASMGIFVLGVILVVIYLGLRVANHFAQLDLSLGGIFGYAFVKTASMYDIQPLTVGLCYVVFVTLMILACVLTKQAFVVKGAAFVVFLVYVIHSFVCLLL